MMPFLSYRIQGVCRHCATPHATDMQAMTDDHSHSNANARVRARACVERTYSNTRVHSGLDRVFLILCCRWCCGTCVDVCSAAYALSCVDGVVDEVRASHLSSELSCGTCVDAQTHDEKALVAVNVLTQSMFTTCV